MINSIKLFREAAGIPQAGLAKKLDVRANTIWRWERGERIPHWNDIKAMCAMFHCSADQLMSPSVDCPTRQEDAAPTNAPTPREIAEEIAEFRDAINDLFPELADRDAYADILLDLKDNGRIDAPEMRAKIERGIKALEASLVA